MSKRLSSYYRDYKHRADRDQNAEKLAECLAAAIVVGIAWYGVWWLI